MAGTISTTIIEQIKAMLERIDYGSIEVYVVNGQVTQLTERRILKTNGHNNGHQNKMMAKQI